MMTVIFLKVWRLERRMRNAGYRSTNAARAAGNEANMIAGNRNQSQASNGGLLRQNVTNSRKVLNQALAYAGAYIATWFFFVFYLFSAWFTKRERGIMYLLATICIPLQGKSHARTTSAVVYS